MPESLDVHADHQHGKRIRKPPIGVAHGDNRRLECRLWSGRRCRGLVAKLHRLRRRDQGLANAPVESDSTGIEAILLERMTLAIDALGLDLKSRSLVLNQKRGKDRYCKNQRTGPGA